MRWVIADGFDKRSIRPSVGPMKRDQIVLGAGLSALLAVCQFRLILLVLGNNFARSIDGAWRITTGHPDWRIAQSRLLGPWIVRVMAAPFGGSEQTYLEAHIAYSIITLAIAGYLAYRLSGLIGLVTLHIGFAALLSPPWLYAWDYLDLIAFLVFVEFVLKDRPWQWFALLYLVAIWNRDSTQFIALWMVLDPVCRWGARRMSKAPTVPFDWWKAGVGAALIPFGMGLLEFLRRTLMIEEMGPKIFSDAPVNTSNRFFGMNLGINLSRIGSEFTNFDPFMGWVIPLFLVATVALSLWVAKRGQVALGLTFIAMTVAELMFAVLYETRTMIFLIPLWVAAVSPQMMGGKTEPAKRKLALGSR